MPGMARRPVVDLAVAEDLECFVDDPLFGGHPAAIAPAPPSQPRDRSGLAPPSTDADGPRASRRPGLSLADDDFRKAAGTTRWMLPRADFLDWRLSKLSFCLCLLIISTSEYWLRLVSLCHLHACFEIVALDISRNGPSAASPSNCLLSFFRGLPFRCMRGFYVDGDVEM